MKTTIHIRKQLFTVVTVDGEKTVEKYGEKVEKAEETEVNV